VSVVTSGTQVTFAEVVGYPWHPASTSPCVRAHRYQRHITSSFGNSKLALSRSVTHVPPLLAVPPAAVSCRPCHITSATESGQPLSYSIGDPQTAVPGEFHALDLSHREQGVRHESVIGEHRVVVAPRHAMILAGGSKS